MKRLIIYGLGDFAKLVRHLAESNNEYSVIGFCADAEFINQDKHLGLPVFPFDAVRDGCIENDAELIVAAGYKSMISREKMFERAKSTNLKIASLISKHAHVDATAKIGENTIIFPGAQVEPWVNIGKNCVIWTSAVLCHDSSIADHCFLAAQSLVGGRAKIGNRSFLGFNSTVLQDISIGNDCLVGAKSLVTKSISDSEKHCGAPAIFVSAIGDEGVTLP